jgi:hypothetical protein
MTITYRNRANKSYEEKFVLDFTEHYGLLYTNDDPYQGIVEKLDAIHTDIKDVTDRGILHSARINHDFAELISSLSSLISVG